MTVVNWTLVVSGLAISSLGVMIELELLSHYRKEKRRAKEERAAVAAEG